MRYVYHYLIYALCFAATFLLVSCTSNADSPPTSLLTVDMDGNTQIILLSDSQQGYWGPAWSPDGSRLVVSVTMQDKGQLFLANSDGSGLVQLTHNERNNYLPAWSSNGELISFISQTDDNTNTSEIYTINANGTHELQLTNNSAWEYGTSWSPDGKKIVFGSNRTGDWQIYTMDPDGSNQQSLPIPAHGNAPVWSPDGSRIVFTSDRDGDDDIWVMNADGSNQVNLTQNDAWDDQPQWSPNGMSIAFTSDRDGTASIFIMNRDGSAAKNLTRDLATDVGIPTWSPDGDHLIFHAVVTTK